MQLFYSPNSPYARKCRVVIREKKLSGIIETRVDVSTNPPELLAINPLGKIPALLTDERLALCDSPLICEYLDHLQSPAASLYPEHLPDRFQCLSLAALADGIMDAAVELILQSRRPEPIRWGDWIERKEQAILRTIETIARQPLSVSDKLLDIGSVTLACALAYVHFRHPHLHWEQHHPELGKWLSHILQRPSFQETLPES